MRYLLTILFIVVIIAFITIFGGVGFIAWLFDLTFGETICLIALVLIALRIMKH